MSDELTELRRFKQEWVERFGFLAQDNPPDSFESIDEVACMFSKYALKRNRLRLSENNEQ